MRRSSLVIHNLLVCKWSMLKQRNSYLPSGDTAWVQVPSSSVLSEDARYLSSLGEDGLAHPETE